MPGADEDKLHVRIAVLEERVRNQAEALVIQAEEYERRLGELNDAHNKATERDAFLLPRELFDRFLTDHVDWRRVVDNGLAEARGKSAAYTAYLALLLAAAAMAVAYFK